MLWFVLAFFGFGAVGGLLIEIAARDEVSLFKGSLALLGAVLSLDCCVISGVVAALLYLAS